MGRENRRPADYQISHVYQCRVCGAETEAPSFYAAPRCQCGGEVSMIGESYPADSEDWDEERDDYHSPWHRR